MRRPSSSSQKRPREVDNEQSEQQSDASPMMPKKKTRRSEVTMEVTEEEDSTYDDNVASILEESGLENPNRKVLRTLMRKTFARRRQWINDSCPKVEDINAKFPPLFQSFKNVSPYFCMCVYVFYATAACMYNYSIDKT